MKKLVLIFVLFISFLFYGPLVSAVEYDISRYDGELTIHDDNTADFLETITYHFTSSYNGQYVTLGTAGYMPSGFAIVGEPEVTAYRDNVKVDVTYEMESWSDGKKLKIYNSGEAGDDVRIEVNWSLENILWAYSDIVELNWTPVSDWDESIDNFNFTITTDSLANPSELYVHTGYFGPKVTQSNSDGIYLAQIATIPEGGKVELHAYWDKSLLSNVESINSQRLDSFLAQEEDIVKKQRIIQLTLFYVLPIGILCIILVSLYLFYRFKQKVDPSSKRLKGRVYMYPEDYTPLMLTEYIYNMSLSQLNPSYAPPSKVVTFDRLIQATLLDLIDRHIISVSDVNRVNRLTWVKEQGLTRYEKRFLKMVFGDKKEINTDEMFSNYTFSNDAIKEYRKKYRGKELENALRKVGHSAVKNMTEQFRSISNAVSDEISSKGMEDNYRDLQADEKKIYRFARLTAFLSLCFNFIFFFLANAYEQSIILLSVFYFVLIFAALTFMKNRMNKYETIGVLTEGGRYRVETWNGFRRMLQDLNRFNKAELSDVVLWNRILVYATLFGFAKKVETYLRIHHISLPSESGLAVAAFHRGYISKGVHHQLTQSVTSAYSASHFSLASSSGVGGSSSSSGGFSGGGGGGGGGAF